MPFLLVVMLFVSGSACVLKKRQWIIIVGTGRSGSTSVLRMVNALPSVHLDGEHFGLMSDVLSIYKKKMRSDRMRGPAWQQREKFDKKRFFCWAQSLLGNETSGFKEIRYNDQEHLDFLSLVFNRAKFVLTYRLNLKDQQKSFRLTHGFAGHSKTLAKETAALHDFYRKKGNASALLFPLENFSKESFTQLYKFLGYPQCRAISVVHANRRNGFEDDKAVNLARCS